MRKESIIIFGLATLISAGIAGGLSYFHYKNNLGDVTSPAIAPGTTDHRLPSKQIPVKPVTRQQARKVPVPKRLKIPQKCIDANGHITITDQPDCANAAPTSRISVIETVTPPPRQKKLQNQSPSRAQKTTIKKLAKKPNLRLGAVSPPRGTPIECKFPMGKALEIERALSAANDPAESIWRKSYCRFIKELRQDGCEISREYFYYSHLCPIYSY